MGSLHKHQHDDWCDLAASAMNLFIHHGALDCALCLVLASNSFQPAGSYACYMLAAHVCMQVVLHYVFEVIQP